MKAYNHSFTYSNSMTFLFMFLLFLTSKAFAQKKDSLLIVGKEVKIYSDILQEQRTYWIYLPPGYHDEQSANEEYPVIYLLDGELNFLPLVGVQASFTRGPRASMPKVIIIGIENTDRTRDLTPTKAVSKKGNATMENSGGGENFVRFLKDELIPGTDQAYRTNNRRFIIGHSFGGLTAMNILFKHTSMFTDYLVIDPSLWWDGQRLMKEASKQLKAGKYKDVKLYIARAGKGTADISPDEKVIAVEQVLEQYQSDGLVYKLSQFEDENHGSVVLPAMFYGLKFLYSVKE